MAGCRCGYEKVRRGLSGETGTRPEVVIVEEWGRHCFPISNQGAVESDGWVKVPSVVWAAFRCLEVHRKGRAGICSEVEQAEIRCAVRARSGRRRRGEQLLSIDVAPALEPLQTLANVQQAISNIPGSTFAIEAAEPLLTTLKEMAEALHCRWIELKAEDKVIYHAAAVIASNYLVTLVKLADDLWETFGIPREQATRALLPLLKGTLNNIENVGIPQALTGPIARGDIETVKKHLAALQKEAPDALSTYCELGLQTIPIAQAKGKIDEEKADELRAVLKAGLKRKTSDNHFENITQSKS